MEVVELGGVPSVVGMPETLAPTSSPTLDRLAPETLSTGEAVESQPTAPPLTAETRGEEVSIDGMCGVY